MATTIKYIFFADFETDFYDDKAYVKAFAYQYSHKQVKKEKNFTQDSINIDNIEWNTTDVEYYDNDNENVIDEFLNTVISLSKPKEKGVDKVMNYWYFHNFSGFDSSFIIYPLIQKGFKQVKNINKFEDKTFSVITINNKILEILVNIDSKLISFRDTLTIFTMKLKDMGVFLDIPKLETDYYIDLKIKNDKYYQYVEYTKRDVEILQKYYKYMTNTNKIDYTSFLTNAGFSKKYMQKYFNEKGYRSEYKDATVWQHENFLDDWRWVNNSYKGGFTTINKNYSKRVLENVSYYDLNSSYPSIMLGLLPISPPMINKPFGKYATMYEVVINNIKLKKNKVPILWKTNARNDFIEDSTTPMIYTLWDEALTKLKEFYDFEYKIVKTRYFKLGYLYTDVIRELYDKRQEYKQKEKNSRNKNESNYYNALQQIVKVIMNSSYGKHGENPQKIINVHIKGDIDEYVFKDEGQNKIYVRNDYIKNTDKETYIKNEPFSKYKDVDLNFYKSYNVKTIHNSEQGYINISILINDEDIKKSGNVAIASYITMLGRMKVWDEILNIGADNFVYCDTDSIITLNNKSPINISNKLGDWKLEGKFNYFLGFKAKQYILTNTRVLNRDSKFTIAGVNDFSSIFNKDISMINTIDGITLTKNQAKKTISGKIITTKEIHIC